MRHLRAYAAVLTCGLALVMTTGAHAHVSIVSGPGVANTSQEVVFGIAHGCDGADTYKLKVEIPAGVTSVRPMNADFGKASVDVDGTGAVTAITWQKADTDLLAKDTHYYKVTARMKLPNAPFTQVYFLAHQTCKDSTGKLTTVDWVALPTTPVPDGGTSDPASVVVVLPARIAGWNKYTVPVDIADLSVFFKDAQIVWKGTSAYSANPNTLALIKAEATVTPLTALKATDEVWVKY